MNLYLDNKDFKNEREFHKHLFKYLKYKIKIVEYEKFYNKEIRPDVYFEYKNKKYIIECKYISEQFSHTDIASFLIQMFNYKQYLGDDYIYLCAICSDSKIIEKKFGSGYLYPTSQLFAALGFYFLKWDKNFPKHFNCQTNTLLSYSNGSGMIHL